MLRLPFRKIYVLPQKYINEYLWKPDDQISSNTDLCTYERFLGRWTYIGSLTPDDSAGIDLGLSYVRVAESLMRVPSWLRPLAAIFMKGPRDVKANVRRMEDEIRPIVKVMQCFIDIALHPEYTDDLRAELQQVADDPEGWSVASLAKVDKMDSFIKESARHVSQNVLSVYRKTLQPLHLSDGTILPASSYVCVPSIDPDSGTGAAEKREVGQLQRMAAG
ncbi:hypothetical protein DV738_g5045, partial [Chaetothyriales sp. CBS 135597]